MRGRPAFGYTSLAMMKMGWRWAVLRRGYTSLVMMKMGWRWKVS